MGIYMAWRAFEFGRMLRNPDLSSLVVRRFPPDSGLSNMHLTAQSVYKQAPRAYQARESYEVEYEPADEDSRDSRPEDGMRWQTSFGGDIIAEIH